MPRPAAASAPCSLCSRLSLRTIPGNMIRHIIGRPPFSWLTFRSLCIPPVYPPACVASRNFNTTQRFLRHIRQETSSPTEVSLRGLLIHDGITATNIDAIRHIHVPRYGNANVNGRGKSQCGSNLVLLETFLSMTLPLSHPSVPSASGVGDKKSKVLDAAQAAACTHALD